MRASSFIFLLAVVLAATTLSAQQFQVLYSFTGGADGGSPSTGLTMDRQGNLYGSAWVGGTGSCDSGCGTVFRLVHKNGWIFTPLHAFQGGPADGARPYADLVFGPDGGLFGTTLAGGSDSGEGGHGTVFELRPSPTVPRTAISPWNETVLYRFLGRPDAGGPEANELYFDAAGAAYGSTALGGFTPGSCGFGTGCGTVFQLVPGVGSWSETLLHSFGGNSDGSYPFGGVTPGSDGALYGTTASYYPGQDTIFKMTRSGDQWTKTILYRTNQQSDGVILNGVAFDRLGNLFGLTFQGGSEGGGTAFEMQPVGGGWSFTVIANLSGGSEGIGARAKPLIDARGNLYGTTAGGGAFNCGNVFELTPSGGTWTYRSLHDFTCGSDGGIPYGKLIIDSDGNLFGTAYGGGSQACYSQGCGVVFEITP